MSMKMAMTKAMPARNPWIVRSTVACMFIALISIAILARGRAGVFQSQKDASMSFLSSKNAERCSTGRDPWIPPTVASALLHYATSKIIPQQNTAEIMLSFKVLAARSPCNFLVFGLGYDSTLWNALNYGGRTVFLEEDLNWINEMHKTHPELKAYHVNYPTNLTQADSLLQYYSSDPSCNPKQGLVGSECKLALTNLPEEIYSVEWDVIMIDAPRGYFDAAPGRMTAIFSASVMARNRNKDGVTDVYLHDVDRKVEKMYAEEFLCRENLVNASGRLWHFRIEPTTANRIGFCRKSARSTLQF
eukprot:Gb_13730 [translate_table: standard]